MPLLEQVALAIALKLGSPKVDASFRSARKPAAGVPVPKAAMYEDDLAAPGEDEVGSPRELPAVKTVAVAEAMHQATNGHFRARTGGTDTGHDLGSLLWGNCVHGLQSAVHQPLLVLDIPPGRRNPRDGNAVLLGDAGEDAAILLGKAHRGADSLVHGNLRVDTAIAPLPALRHDALDLCACQRALA